MTTRGSEKMARRFVFLLTGRQISLFNVPEDLQTLYRLAEAGYTTYQHRWKCGRQVVGWKYPFEELTDGGVFPGPEPWDVLFREAVLLWRAAGGEIPPPPPVRRKTRA